MGQDSILPAGLQPARSNFVRMFGSSGHFSFVKGFYCRRLPHLDVRHTPVFVTWRLYGSLPARRYFDPALTAGRAFVAMDSLLDRATSGPLYLKIPEIADLTVGALRYGQEALRQYELHAWVVMANHVHLLITPDKELATITHSLKRFTAREANRVLGVTGPFWQDESFDHVVRNDQEFARIFRYIEQNPVSAGLVSSPEEFDWSSARAG